LRTGRRPWPPAAPAEETLERAALAEDVAELGEDVLHAHVVAAAKAAVHALVAEPVVPLAFFGVAEHLVGLGRLLELLLRRGVVGVLVRVKLDCHHPVRLLDLIDGGRFAHPQYFVIVSFRSHVSCEVTRQ
jgi:hypothetical protein